MPLDIILDDIVNVKADIYVNSAHKETKIGTGVDLRIHEVAGPKLFKDRVLFGLLTHDHLFESPGYLLKAKKVYHILTPVYETQNSIDILKKTYERCLIKAISQGYESIAFPLLASANHGFPKPLALEIAISTFKTFLNHHDLDIILTVYDKNNYQIEESKKQSFDEIPVNINDTVNYLKAPEPNFPILSESFHDMLFRLIDETDQTDVEVYKKANLSRKLFSKIRSDESYQPSKKTIIALAIGLKLNLDQTLDFLSTAGYTLSNSLAFDRVIEMFIEQEKYDIFEINEFLFYYDLPVL